MDICEIVQEYVDHNEHVEAVERGKGSLFNHLRDAVEETGLDCLREIERGIREATGTALRNTPAGKTFTSHKSVLRKAVRNGLILEGRGKTTLEKQNILVGVYGYDPCRAGQFNVSGATEEIAKLKMRDQPEPDDDESSSENIPELVAKLYYSLDTEEREQFQAAMRDAVPELFH